MNETQSEHLNSPISTTELERRWKAVRSAMRERKVDFLLMQNTNDHLGGYVKYFTDIPATFGFPTTLLFPVDEDMTVISHGPFGFDKVFDSNRPWPWRGVRRHLGTPNFVTASYTKEYQAELVVKALDGYARGTIGLVAPEALSFPLVEYLRRQIPGAELIDASTLVDEIKAVKSDEELACIRRTAHLQDEAMNEVRVAIRPGMKEIELSAIAQMSGLKSGSENGAYLAGSAPVGSPSVKYDFHGQQRRLQKGDVFTLLIENNGPGGFYAELGRTIILGKAPAQLVDEFEMSVEVQDFAARLLVPGIACADVWGEYKTYMTNRKLPVEGRLYCHGQGYDLVERPLIRFDEPMTLRQNMNMALHPTCIPNRTHGWLCDNFLIGTGGQNERLHSFPRQLIEVDI